MKWNYQSIFWNYTLVEAQRILAEQGGNGWELVGIYPVKRESAGPQEGLIAIFKQPVGPIQQAMPDFQQGVLTRRR